MKLRKITSLTVLLSFIFLVVNSAILFIMPHGRVAYWSDWRFWGLSKTQWTDLHINVGILFVIGILVHTYFNWKPIVTYLKNKAKELRIFTGDFVVSLILLIVFCVGTFFVVPPFSWVLKGGEAIKEAAIEKYGEPPYGHAELSSLKIFSQKVGLDAEAAMVQLAKAGIKFENGKQTIKEIAENNGIRPKDVYQAMLPEDMGDKSPALPEQPKPGLGKRVLKDICQEFELDVTFVVKALAAEGIEGSGEMTIKEIGEKNQMSPIDVYTVIRNAVVKE